MPVLDVLAVGAHPDDLEILCGGTLALLARQGYRVGIVDLSDGEPTPRGDPEIRAREAEAARVALGVSARFCLGLTNREIMDAPPARYALATLLRRTKPRVLIGVAGRTPAASPDHYQAQLIIEAARFYSQLTKWDDRFGGTTPHRVPRLVYTLFPFDAERRHWPGSFVVDISSTFDAKLEAVRCYRSQFDEKRARALGDFLLARDTTAGVECGFGRGEVFALPHPVGVPDLVKLVEVGGEPPASAAPGRDHLPFA